MVLLNFFNFIFISLFFSFFLFFGGGGLHPQHMEVPRLGVELALQLLAYTTAIATLDLSCSETYTIAHVNTQSLTHGARPGIEPTSSWILVGFFTAEP